MRHPVLTSLGIGGAMMAGFLGYHVFASEDPLWATTLTDIAAGWSTSRSSPPGLPLPPGPTSVNVEFVVNQCSPLVATDTHITASLPEAPRDAVTIQSAPVDVALAAPVEVAILKPPVVVKRADDGPSSGATGFSFPTAPRHGAPIQLSPSILYLP